MITINGYTLHLALPVFAGGKIAGYVVALANDREAVSATVRNLDDQEWNAGRYFRSGIDSGIAVAAADAHDRWREWSNRLN